MDEELALIIKYIEEVNNVRLDLRQDNLPSMTVIKVLMNFYKRNESLMEELQKIQGVGDFPQEILLDYDKCIYYIDR